MKCVSPTRINHNSMLFKKRFPDGIDVPCGRCAYCKQMKRRLWSLRLWHEFGYHDKSQFLTLTYNDENLPSDFGLCKKDLQLFFKRLRKNLSGRRIKYYASGEYGDNNYRPHYHAILFNVGCDKVDKQIVRDSWQKGFTYQLPVTDHRLEYVCKYVNKKMYDDMITEAYGDKEQPFCLMSKGIGLKFIEDNQEAIRNYGYVTKNGVKYAIPRYYIKVLKLNLDLKGQIADSENVEKFLGYNIGSNDLYKLNQDEFMKYYESEKKYNDQNQKNIIAKNNIFKSKM